MCPVARVVVAHVRVCGGAGSMHRPSQVARVMSKFFSKDLEKYFVVVTDNQSGEAIRRLMAIPPLVWSLCAFRLLPIK